MEEIRFGELAAYLLEIGAGQLVMEMVPPGTARDSLVSDPEQFALLDGVVAIDAEFYQHHEPAISGALLRSIELTLQDHPDLALDRITIAMNVLTRLSMTASRNSLAQLGNAVLQRFSAWRSKADSIKKHLNASGYTIGINLGIGVYVEMHF